MDLAAQKASLRRLYRQRRNALSGSEQAAAALALKQQFSSLIQPSEHQNIALFIANDGEISPELIAQSCWQSGMNTYLPVVDTQRTGHLQFRHYNQFTQFQNNQFGIPEPSEDARCINTTDLDLVIMPLVAFDTNGNRLGMGGGFYDRTFAHIDSVDMIGVAHDCQLADHLPVESWDITLNAILTPTRFIPVR